MNVTNIFPIRDSLDDSGCRRVNEQTNRMLLAGMSTPDLESHIGELAQELSEARHKVTVTEAAYARALNERLARR